MKKDLAAIAAVALVVVLILVNVDFKSVNEYYDEHIGDVSDGTPAVTVSIDCRRALDGSVTLDAGGRDSRSLPADGMILSPTVVALREGDTAYSVLTRICRVYRIQIEEGGSNKYSTKYIKGINWLYEFDCGPLSGWEYSVNGVFPSVGCSSLTLADGDTLSWVYTCELGHDVGDNYYQTGEAAQ